ncbi:MAG: DUF4364 family protein [Christensenellales bacterium]|jgi:hypothetical protein
MIHDENINNKLLILFILGKLEMPIDEDILLELCSSEYNLIPYMYCKHVIYELIEFGFVKKIATGQNKTHLVITSEGRNCLESFYNDIPKSLRDDISEILKRDKFAMKVKQEFISDYYKNADNTFTVSLKILDIDKEMFKLELNLDKRQKALALHNNWVNKAPEVYKAIYELLLED